ncbi:MAG: hypothetical protein NTU53_22980 [Planctomycetota bacterium]|nr:hypothetical protein [Planctomycetota bacterium]
MTLVLRAAILARRRLEAALTRSFAAILKDAAANDYRYRSCCTLILPEGPNSKLPTPERVARNNRRRREFSLGWELIRRPGRFDTDLLD